MPRRPPVRSMPQDDGGLPPLEDTIPEEVNEDDVPEDADMVEGESNVTNE